MGLLDQVIGSVLGSRMGGGGLGGALGGGFGQQGRSGGQGGMSPIMMALMGLLASKAMGNRGGGMGGGLGGLLGGALGGGMAGGALGGGLGGLLQQFQNSGHHDKINSWIGSGDNQPIAPHELGSALGDDTVETLSRETGLPRGDLLSELSQVLPGVVDKLTPHGRMPHDEEVSRW